MRLYEQAQAMDADWHSDWVLYRSLGRAAAHVENKCDHGIAIKFNKLRCGFSQEISSTFNSQKMSTQKNVSDEFFERKFNCFH